MTRLVCCLLALAVVGCGGRGEKGKYLDHDRPKATSPASPKG